MYSPTCNRLLLMSFTLMGSGAAIAQNASSSVAGAEFGLEEVVVTAARRETKLQETPIAVTALSAKALEDLQITEVQDLQNFVPGLKLLDNVTSPTNFTVALRGSVQQDSALIVAESPVGMYVDDVYLGRLNGANIQFSDIESIEVLRGPQGTLYGRNSLAGAVKINSRRPGEKSWFNASAGFGSDGDYKGSVSAGGALDDSWGASFAAIANGTDGYKFNRVTKRDVGENENYAVRTKVRFSSDGLDVIGTLSFADGQSDAFQPIPAQVPATGRFTTDDIRPFFGPYTNSIAYSLFDPVSNPTGNTFLPVIPPTEAAPRAETQQSFASLSVNYEIGKSTFKSITAYVRTEDFFNVDFSGLGQAFASNASDTKQLSQEFQWQGNSDNGSFEWITGVFFFRERGEQVVSFITLDSLNIETDSYAIFGQGTWRVSDALSLTAGLRYTKDQKTFQGQIRPLLLPFSSNFNSKNSYDALTPKVSIDYQVAGGSGELDSLLGYFSASTGFKSGGYNGIAFGDPVVLATVYGEETSRSYEVGLKADMFDRRLRANAALFVSEISDLAANAIVPSVVPGVPPSFPVQNVGDVRISGLELEISAVPVAGLTLFLNGTFQDNKYTRLIPGAEAALSRAANNGQIEAPQTPKAAYSAGFTYERSFGFGKMSLGADVFRTGDFYIAAGNDLRVKAYSRLNGFVGLQFGDHWSIRLTGSDLGDNATFFSGIRGNFFNGFQVLPPRKYMATVSYTL